MKRQNYSDELYVCHSVGDTNVILEIAAKRIKSENNIHIFVIGEAAKRKLDQLNENHPLRQADNLEITTLDDVTDESTMKDFDDAPLPDHAFKTVKDFLDNQKIKSALIGTPSKNNATLPFQIAEYLSDKMTNGVIYNDYLFKDPEHFFWGALTNTETWQKQFIWAMPLLAASKQLEAVNSNVKVVTTGHPSIDAMLESENKVDITVRDKLKIDEESSLLFISGTKDIKHDQQLLAEIFEARDKTQAKNVQIRFGIHPGVSDLNAYIQGLIATTKKADEHPGDFFKFIITDRLKDRIDSNAIDQSLLIFENVNGDQCADAADGVACSVPATLATKAAIGGKPAYYADSTKQSYLPPDRMFVGAKNISPFFKQVSDRKVSGLATREELGLENESAVEQIIRHLGR